jgi:hypothetical protein
VQHGDQADAGAQVVGIGGDGRQGLGGGLEQQVVDFMGTLLSERDGPQISDRTGRLRPPLHDHHRVRHPPMPRERLSPMAQDPR